MTALTARQIEILRLIDTYIAEHAYPPTRREIGKAAGIRSNNAVAEHLDALALKGVLRIAAGVSRGLRITDAGREVLDRELEDRDGV
jgi:repressor LexA